MSMLCCRCEHRALYLEGHKIQFPKSTCSTPGKCALTCDAWIPQKPQVMLKVEQSKNAAWQAGSDTVEEKSFNREFELATAMVQGKTLVLWVARSRRLRMARELRQQVQHRVKPRIDLRRREYRGKSIEELVELGVV